MKYPLKCELGYVTISQINVLLVVLKDLHLLFCDLFSESSIHTFFLFIS